MVRIVYIVVMKKILILLLMFILQSPLQSQEVYVDVNPDTVLNMLYGESFYPDLDSDGTIDIGFHQFHSGIDMLNTTMSSSSVILEGTNGVAVDSIGNVLALNQGSLIGPTSAIWHDNVNVTILNIAFKQYVIATNYLSTSGSWSGVSDKFLGVRFYINGQRHYGWIRMSVTIHTATTIKDWAYNPIPDSSILAGAGWVLGTNTISNDLDLVYAYDQSVFIKLENPAQFNVTLFNTIGQRIARYENLPGGEPLTTNTLGSGVYIVMVEQNGKHFSRKVVIY